MAIFKRGKYWWLRLEFNGVRYERSTRLKNEREALKVEAAFRTQLALGEYGLSTVRPATPTFRTYSEEFTKYVEVHSAEHPGTIKFYAFCLKTLLAFKPLADTPLNKIDTDLVEKYIQHRCRTVRPATVNRELATLSKALHLARDVHKRITRFPKVPRLRGEKEREFILSADQEKAYLAVCHDDLRDFAILALDTGIRVSEGLALEWDDVFPTYIRIRQGKSKAAKRNIVLSERCRRMLDFRRLMLTESIASTQLAKREAGRVEVMGEKAMPTGARFVFPGNSGHRSISGMEYLHIQARDKARLEDGSSLPGKDFVLHSLRHTFGTRLGESGADAFTICKAMGHSNIRISSRYIHPTPETMERAFARLDAMNRIMRGEVHEETPSKVKR